MTNRVANFADPAPTARRFGGIAFVGLLHLAIVYALVTGLGHEVVEILRAPIETKLIDEIRPPPPEPPPPLMPPQFAALPPPYIPPPEIQVRQPPPPNAIAVVTREKPAEPPPPIGAQVAPTLAPVAVRTAPVIDGRRCRLPEYPPGSKRMEEAGIVVLRFLIDVDGSVVESKVESSSGYPRLDEAARAALALCSFKAGTVDGKAERSWAKLRYVWKLN